MFASPRRTAFAALVGLVAASALAGCGRAPSVAAPQARAAQLQAQSATSVVPMRPLVNTLMVRCFEIMTAGYGEAKESFSAAELGQYLALGGDQAKALFKAVDANQDGQGSSQELQAWGGRAGGLTTMRDALIEPAMAAADANGDKRLSLEEAAGAALNLDQGPWPLLISPTDFAKLDLDKDGLLAPVEFNALAAGKLNAALKAETGKALAPRVAKPFFRAIPWSH